MSKSMIDKRAWNNAANTRTKNFNDQALAVRKGVKPRRRRYLASWGAIVPELLGEFNKSGESPKDLIIDSKT
jgi:hypothetical protein